MDSYPKERPKAGNFLRLVVGAAVSFVFMVLMYGMNQTTQLLALAVVCTAGIGLIPILFVSWLVGWIVLEVWFAVSNRGPAIAS